MLTETERNAAVYGVKLETHAQRLEKLYDWQDSLHRELRIVEKSISEAEQAMRGVRIEMQERGLT